MVVLRDIENLWLSELKKEQKLFRNLTDYTGLVLVGIRNSLFKAID